MEFVAGRSLASLLAAGPLPVPRALLIAGQVAAGLDAAHTAGVVHRDLKPDNVHLVERDGEPEQVKLLDFGIAKVRIEESGPPSQITRLGSVFGTPEYMAPEQAAGAAVDHRADLYALGLLLHEMLTGQAPFQGDVVHVMTQQMTVPPPPLPDRVPPDLRALCSELLEKEPDRRPQTALEVAQRIGAILDRREAVANASTELAVDMSATRPPRRWLLAAIAAASLLVIAVASVVTLARARRSAEGPRLLERGAFSVDVPAIQSPPKPPPRAERPAPPPAPAATASSTPAPAKSPKSSPKQKKKKTGPAGIYIPPPSEWF
jgi:serine/threonine protein kinase